MMNDRKEAHGLRGEWRQNTSILSAGWHTSHDMCCQASWPKLYDSWQWKAVCYDGRCHIPPFTASVYTVSEKTVYSFLCI